MDIVRIAPENLDVANAYLTTGSAEAAAEYLSISADTVHSILERSEVKQYMNSVYLDQGYRNRFKLAGLLDRMIDEKVKEAEESGMYTSKDLADLLALAHKISTDYSKAGTTTIRQQNNVQINSPFGEGNYGRLMEKLIGRSGEG